MHRLVTNTKVAALTGVSAALLLLPTPLAPRGMPNSAA
jgi:hypothetical protein